MIKKIVAFLVIVMNICFLSANVNIKYKGNSSGEVLTTVEIDSLDYFNIYELNKVFRAYIKEDIFNQKTYVTLYKKQFIILLDSSFASVNGQIFNMIYPTIRKDKKLYLPVTFIFKVLEPNFENAIKIGDKKTLIAKIPVDHSIKRIVLDPGHGGKDPGAIGFSKKNYEKDVALDVTKLLKRKLEKELNVEVLLTRSKDEFVSLQKRTRFANKNKADLFISIHCNASKNKNSNGTEVFFLSNARTTDARAVEALENSVVYEYEGGEEAVKEYDGLAFILMDMAQSEHLDESSHLAVKLQEYLVSSCKSRDRGVKQAGFYVLRGAYMPSVLIELGFISNKKEEKLLVDKKYQKLLSDAIYEGIKSFKIKYDAMR